MSEIVERLRAEVTENRRYEVTGTLALEAADEIARLIARVAELEGALRQIAGIDPWDDAEQGYVDKARAALTQPTPEKKDKLSDFSVADFEEQEPRT